MCKRELDSLRQLFGKGDLRLDLVSFLSEVLSDNIEQRMQVLDRISRNLQINKDRILDVIKKESRQRKEAVVGAENSSSS